MGGSSPAFNRRARRKYVSLSQTSQREEFSDSWSRALASFLSRCPVVLRPKSIQPNVWWHLPGEQPGKDCPLCPAARPHAL